MTILIRNGAPLTRRRLLTTAASSAALLATGAVARPYLSRAPGRPAITHGLQSGDVSTDSGVVWARADRPARMLVEASTTDSFKTIRSAIFVDALPETDFTAKALIEGLPAGQDIFYRISFQAHATPTLVGEPQVGHFRTAPSDRRSIFFVWSGAQQTVSSILPNWGCRNSRRRLPLTHDLSLRRERSEPTQVGPTCAFQ